MTPESNKEDHNGNEHNPAKRSYLQMMMGSRSEGKFKCILSPIYENESVAKRVHMDMVCGRGMRRLFSSNNEIPTTSRDYNSDEASTSQSTGRNEFLSPTLNLPNFVMDGTAPHLLEISPQKYKENVDWLTKIRKERYEQKKIASTSSSPKTQTPSRRSNRSRSTEPQKVTKTTKSSSLLDFFKTVSKNSEKDFSSDNNNLPPTNTS